MKLFLVSGCLFLIMPLSAQGQFGDNAWFNGTNARISVGRIQPIETNSITIEGWIYAEQGTFDNNYSEIIRQDRNSGSTPDFLLSFQYASGSNRVLSFGLFTTSYTELDVTLPFSDFKDTWNHVAAVYDKGTGLMSLYVNGALKGSSSKSGSVNYTSAAGYTNLGSSFYGGNPNEYFAGNLDEMRIWSRARTPDEILATMNDTLSPAYYSSLDSGLVAYWRLDELNGSVTPDLSVSGLDGTVFNATIGSGNPLPVELSSFAHVGGKLIWRTATETNNAGWEVQRKNSEFGIQNSEEWKSIGFVAGAGSSTEERSYSFSLPEVKETIRVRLRQIDTDGTVSYSQILNIEAAPAGFQLLGNYPNPFNPATVIRYQLAENSTVNLQVYDVTGRLVTTLVDGKKDAGVHEAEFTASGLSSGLYVYRISAGSFSAVKTMMLVK